MFDVQDVTKVFSGEVALNWKYKSKYIKEIQNDNDIMFDSISKYLKTNTSLIEIGCGTGRLLEKLDSHFKNISLTGIEPSIDMLKQIKNINFKNKVLLHNLSIEDFYTDDKYDIVVLKQVFHHVVNRVNVLEKLSQIVKDDGVILIMVPNENYQRCIIPFNNEYDLLGRISDDMFYSYVSGTNLSIKNINKYNFKVEFAQLNDYFKFMCSIGAIQKLFNYQDDYKVCLKFISLFEELFQLSTDIFIDFSYSYITLSKN